jgi:transposase InsO family protein
MADKKAKNSGVRYDFAFKLKVVRTALEKNLTREEIRQVFGVSDPSFKRWRHAYLSGGEEGLRRFSGVDVSKQPGSPKPPTPEVRRQILETKRSFPAFGIVRIWHWLRRMCFLVVSRALIRRTLHEEGLLQSPAPKKRRPPEPKSFERARPNQLWQSDITTFTLARGLRVYLIGFLDDHSRYLVGWSLHATQKGGLVVETLRQAIALYGRPEEILTDNGRQYKSWRGETDFEKELRREQIRHITSRPHHPQTLGKIEAFWGHLKREFLRHVSISSLEEMRERLTHWIAHYNFQRPHEGIGHLAPAERFFQFAHPLREEIEKRIDANERSLALAPPAEGPKTVAEVAFGDTTLGVTKEDGHFVVRMCDREVVRTTLDPRKESIHEAQEEPAGTRGGDGPGGEGEGGGRAASPGGGEDHPRGVRGDGDEQLALLQTGGQDDRRDAARGEDPGRQPPSPGSAGGGGSSGGADTGAAGGASPPAVSAAGVPEGVPRGAPEAAPGTAAPARGSADGTAGEGGSDPDAGGSSTGVSDDGGHARDSGPGLGARTNDAGGAGGETHRA